MVSTTKNYLCKGTYIKKNEFRLINLYGLLETKSPRKFTIIHIYNLFNLFTYQLK